MENNVEVTIDSKAKKYIKDRGGVAQLSLYETINKCCIGGAAEVEVTLNRPSEEKRFHKHHEDGIDIYIEKSLNFKNGKIIIALSGFGLLKGLKATGLKRF
ncbi:CC/Se motif family (seleno)protein [Bacillus sp. FJAT-45350]|uniref:CC/Se motif family (seleno)protein n=1 Tax=Bacillus sp. FJAT-45350 TaxID=2011014 RepID=UPI000BB77E83|nr:CC/Se motif family (seleno)protein [Bacillus sp. FJAT-45350]